MSVSGDTIVVGAFGEDRVLPGGQVDLLATIADVVGVELEPGQGEDSFSFLPVLQDERSLRASRPRLVHRGRGRFAIRDGRWKLIFGKDPDGRRVPGQPAELFDLEADPA